MKGLASNSYSGMTGVCGAGFCRRYQSGLTLIEVLVALVIMTVGLLGAVGLQLVSKRNNLDAGQRTLAARITGDMIERMRANRSFNALQIYVAQGSSLGGASIATEPSPACSGAAPCNPVQLARHDLWQWEKDMDGAAEVIQKAGVTSVVGGLAFPTGCIIGPGDGSSGIYTVTVAWRGGVELPDDAAEPCGQDDANYGEDGEYRRSVSMQIYITN